MPNPYDGYSWLNPPQDHSIVGDQLTFNTEPETDFWQRTYYGFRNDNAHAFLFPTDERLFTYRVRVRYVPKKLYDQAGLLLRVDADNWSKAAMEVENASTARLGSVVTNFGYSDWASVDVPNLPVVQQYYRISRREKDFLLETSADGETYQQMRIFHLHQAETAVMVGVYACSPTADSFEVEFSELAFGDCLWEPHPSD